jgi:5,10-methenyltetrahydrofolate synthetase
MSPEVDLWPLVEHGKRIAIPRIVDRSQGLMTFDLLPQTEQDDQRAYLVEGAFGIPQAQTPDEVLAEAIDVVLVPATAVDTDGNRLGGGAGYYDRWLDRARRSSGPAPYALGVVFAEQVVPAGTFPVEPHDQPLDGVVTQNGLTTFVRPTPLG